MSNPIVQRIADFVATFAPFRLMNEVQLLALCQQAEVIYQEKGELVFSQGEAAHACFYCIKEGAIQLLRQEGAEELLVDVCDEGDLFGLRPLLADQPYGLEARAAENTLLYGFKIQQFKAIMAEDARVSLYLAQYFAAGVHLPYEQAYRNAWFFHPAQKEGTHLAEVQQLNPVRTPVTCSPAATIREAAGRMQQEQVSSILILNAEDLPRGIITDKDLRNQVATGAIPLDASVQRLMSSPVRCIPPGLSVVELQLFMIRHQVHHLAITLDGTDQSPLIGVLTEHDLLVAQANNPAAMVRKIKHSYSLEGLRDIREKAEDLLSKYLEQKVAISYISEVMSQINDMLIQRVIYLEQEKMDRSGYRRPVADFCWLGLGSAGRAEQLLRTDQDSALVFADVPLEQLEDTRQYFLSLARRVTISLEACGFAFCPSDMMASNPAWCLSLQEWKVQFHNWMMSPTPASILMATIFFDFRLVYGAAPLADTLTSFIFQHIDQRTPFLHFLARDAVQNPPPLSFFRQFLVEKNGAHKDTFDIKARAMLPLADAARLLVLATKMDNPTNTVQRFLYLARQEPENADLYVQAAEAYELLMGLRARFGLQQRDSGRFVPPAALSKMQRLQLRNCFQPIRALQSLLSTRYQLAFHL